jgi:hypothetical protein
LLGADHVGLPALVRVRLEQRQVLERRRVEHHVGAVLLEQLEHAVAVADVGEQQIVAVEQRPAVDRQLHGVQAALVAVELEERRGLEAGELAAQLAADRAARTGDEHAPAGDVARHRVGVDVGGRGGRAGRPRTPGGCR